MTSKEDVHEKRYTLRSQKFINDGIKPDFVAVGTIQGGQATNIVV